jgi:Phasin protein
MNGRKQAGAAMASLRTLNICLKFAHSPRSQHHRKETAMPANKAKTEASKAPSLPDLASKGLPMAAGTVAVQAWMDMGTEAVRFVWDRLQQDIKAQQAMLGCTSLAEMQQVQAEFFTALQEQYAAEAARMMDLMGKVTASGLTTPAERRRYDDVPV